jgi:GT2 family glycosyltransferase
MRPIAIVIPSAGIKDAVAVGKQACDLASVETKLIISPDPDQTGFTRTVNRGLEQVPEDYDILLLNDDVEGFYPGWLYELQTAMYGREDIGVIGPSGDCATAPIDTWQVGAGVGLVSVKWFPFFCSLIHRECYDQVGKLDERFIHYASDYVFCDEARYRGWLVIWDRDVVLDHELNGSNRRQAWAGHDLSLYQLTVKRRMREGTWIEVPDASPL